MTDQTETAGQDPREPFRFTDADGDYLHIGIPATPANGGPAISFHTATEPVHLPVAEIEGLIATLRRLAAAATAGLPGESTDPQPRPVYGPDNHSEIAMRGWTA